MVNLNYMRPQKAKDLKERYENIKLYDKPLSVESYHDAIILPARKSSGLLFGLGGLLSKNGFVEESTVKGSFGGNYNFDDSIYKDEKVVYCGCLLPHWGHFLVEGINRLWYFLNKDDSIDKYVFFINENEEREIKGNFEEFFILLGIWDKLEIINRPTQYKEVLLPQKSCQRPYYFSKEYNAIFDEVIKNTEYDEKWISYDKIFLTRSQFAGRSDIGNDMLDNYFENNGFKIIAPEKETLSYLIFLIQKSSLCACVSGTLTHNMMFSQNEKNFIIVERVVVNNEYAVLTNSARNLNVIHIDGYISIYTTDLGDGPFLTFYKGLLENFTNDNGMNPPDEKFLSEKHEKKCFRQYMKVYRQNYGYSWFMYNWSYSMIDLYREAYNDSLLYFREYIYEIKPFSFLQVFSKKIIKQYVKRILNKF